MPLISQYPIELRPDCQLDNLDESVLQSKKPILIKGLVNDWPMVKASRRGLSQALDYLMQFDSGLPLTVYTAHAHAKGRLFYNKEMNGFNFSQARSTFTEVVQALSNEQDKTYYIGSTMLERWLPAFRDQNNLNLMGNDAIASFWFGNQSRVAAHYDFPNNIACCVLGKRRFTLFPPEQIDNLYVGPVDFTPSGQAISLVDFEQIDYAKYPKFREAEKSAIVVELEPGDAIFIPSMWWHQVEALENFNALVNFWWRTTPEYHGAPLAALQHAVLGLANLPKEQKKAWRKIFDYYVFGETNFDHIPAPARGILSGLDEQQAINLRQQLIKQLS